MGQSKWFMAKKWKRLNLGSTPIYLIPKKNCPENYNNTQQAPMLLWEGIKPKPTMVIINFRNKGLMQAKKWLPTLVQPIIFPLGVKGGVRFWCSHILTCFHKFQTCSQCFCEVPKLHFQCVNPIETLKLYEMLKFYTT
jgi:hypothetical protein